MAGAMYGADPDVLDDVAGAMKTAAEELESERQQLTALLHSIEWLGPVAAVFEQRWNGGCAADLSSSAAFLGDIATELNRQASEQRQASEGGPGASVGANPGGVEAGAGNGPPPVRPGDEKYSYEEYAPPDYTLYDQNGEPVIDDIDQGNVGDCWLMASMGSAALLDPEKLRDQIVANPDGTYTVTLYEKRVRPFWFDTYEAVEVTVDDEFLSSAPGTPIYARTNGVLWAMVMEKAMAKHFGGYEELHFDSPIKALEAINGRDYHAVVHDAPNYTDVATTPGSVLLSTGGDSTLQGTNKIFGAHAYTVESVNNQDGTVTLYNPHGPGERVTVPISDLGAMFPTTYEPE